MGLQFVSWRTPWLMSKPGGLFGPLSQSFCRSGRFRERVREPETKIGIGTETKGRRLSAGEERTKERNIPQNRRRRRERNKTSGIPRARLGIWSSEEDRAGSEDTGGGNCRHKAVSTCPPESVPSESWSGKHRTGAPAGAKPASKPVFPGRSPSRSRSAGSAEAARTPADLPPPMTKRMTRRNSGTIPSIMVPDNTPPDRTQSSRGCRSIRMLSFPFSCPFSRFLRAASTARNAPRKKTETTAGGRETPGNRHARPRRIRTIPEIREGKSDRMR